MRICQQVRYSGRVQGVGFRYTTLGLARGYAVTGYVQNLPDGRVELVAEGEPKEVANFLRTVANHLAGYIHHQEEANVPPGEFADFSIRR